MHPLRFESCALALGKHWHIASTATYQPLVRAVHAQLRLKRDRACFCYPSLRLPRPPSPIALPPLPQKRCQLPNSFRTMPWDVRTFSPTDNPIPSSIILPPLTPVPPPLSVFLSFPFLLLLPPLRLPPLAPLSDHSCLIAHVLPDKEQDRRERQGLIMNLCLLLL